jgi:hypothetical protein
LYCPSCDSEQLKVGLCDDLSEERIERDPTLCELLNKDIGFFVNHACRVLLVFTFLLVVIYFLVGPSSW